ncbi:hypothetical protein HDU97_006926 [Phlyctochytrium planicorne]|nr:hypothetical protein HDU97_006926 [Phlyctochytrium planicorne]
MLGSLLDNFDLELTNARKRLKTSTDDACMAYELRCDAIISILPEGVRDLTVKEFVQKYNGSVELYEKTSLGNALGSKRSELPTPKKGILKLQSKPTKPGMPTTSSTLGLPETPLFRSHLNNMNPQYSGFTPRRITFMNEGLAESDLIASTSGISIPLDNGATIIDVPLTSSASAANFKALGKDRKEEFTKKLREAKDNLEMLLKQLDEKQ